MADQSHEHHHHHAIEHDESNWAHKPGSIAPHDTGVRYDTVHMGIQPATVNPLPNEPWVSSTTAQSHNDKEHGESNHHHHHIIEKDESAWAHKQGDYSTSAANDEHTNFVPAFDATVGNRFAGQEQAELQAHAVDHPHGHAHHDTHSTDESASQEHVSRGQRVKGIINKVLHKSDHSPHHGEASNETV